MLGIQAQDLRAAGLADPRPGPRRRGRESLAAAGLVRTWTVRGTVHLVAADDLPWIDALTGPRNRRRFDALMVKRDNLGDGRGDPSRRALEILADGPMTRAELIERLDERGLPSLGPHSINILMPWLASTGEVLGLADGSFRRADPPPPVDGDEALATLGRRYLAGYGPAGPEDLARWSGLPITACRRALAAVDDAVDGRRRPARPAGTLGEPPPRAAGADLLGAFDTSMLGWRTREPLVAAADDRRIAARRRHHPPASSSSTAGRPAPGSSTGPGRAPPDPLRLVRRPPAPPAALAPRSPPSARWLGLELERLAAS